MIKMLVDGAVCTESKFLLTYVTYIFPCGDVLKAFCYVEQWNRECNSLKAVLYKCTIQAKMPRLLYNNH